MTKTIKFEVKNRFSGAVQFTAEIECAEDTLPSVKLGLAVKWAFKTGANLVRANLDGANLVRANLVRARMSGQPIIDGGLRSDGYRFWFTAFKEEGARIKAGCRNFRGFEEARAHWVRTRAGTALGDETFAILDHLERMAVGRRFIPAPAFRTPQATVIVRGGVVQDVVTPPGLIVEVRDYDVDGGDDTTQLSKDDDGKPCVIATYGDEPAKAA